LRKVNGCLHPEHSSEQQLFLFLQNTGVNMCLRRLRLLTVICMMWPLSRCTSMLCSFHCSIELLSDAVKVADITLIDINC